MWKKPLQKGNRTESDYAYDSKILYCIAKLNDEYDVLDTKSFQRKFEELLTDIDYPWKHKKKDGSLRIPSYKQIVNNWYEENKWDDCAKAYANDHLEPQKAEALIIYDKKFKKDTIADFQLIDSLRDRIKVLQQREKQLNEDHTYRIAKLEETINSIWHRIRERLELDKAEDDKHALIPVNNKPLHENQDLRDAWNELLWEHVEPRS